MDLSDLKVLIESEEEKEYKKNQTVLSTTVAYLIGVPWELCKYYSEENKALFDELDTKADARIMRALCSLRTNLMLYFTETSRALRYDLKGLGDLEWCKSDIKTLTKEEIFLDRASTDLNEYIADINRRIADRVNSIRVYFPDWIKWDYIKALFLMPKGQKAESIMAESKKFRKSKSYYPYTRYINWEPYDCGNILINDSKFAKVLYDINNDYFDDYSKVKDAKESVVKNIYEFIGESESLQLVVDCENSDAFKLASVLKQLDEDELDRIDKIVLYDDVHTTNAWSYLDRMTDIPIEHIIVERIKEDKSLVDIKMGMGISKAFYSDNITSFILLSSDSDFWGVISSLPDADFLVMVERSKCGPDIQNALEEDGTYYCFIDDFCTANINHFKDAMLKTALEEELTNLIHTNAKDLLNEIYYNLRLNVSDAEKQNFYDRVVKKMTLVIDKNGNIHIKLPS